MYDVRQRKELDMAGGSTSSASVLPFQVSIILPDGTMKRDTLEFTPESWRSAASTLAEKVLEETGRNVCIISGQYIEEADRTKDEHVVPQGLGTRWIKLPPGLVHDEVNNDNSHGECELQRKGMLGVLRPFYISEKKCISFSSDDSNHRIVFRQCPDAGFSIELHGVGFDPDDEAHGPGHLSFSIPVEEPDPLQVSRALHKIAYLALCVRDPRFTHDARLFPVRAFITNGHRDRFRPYHECFIPDASPGFGFCYLFHMIEIENKVQLAGLFCHFRLHHVEYTVDLYCPGASLRELSPGSLHNEPDKQLERAITTISFGFDKLEPVIDIGEEYEL